MKKNKPINHLINFIAQKQNKQQIICKFHIVNKMQLILLNFLWKNKIIYGYTLNTNHNNIFFYLKNRHTAISYKKININNTKKKLLKEKLWSKNNFLIIKTNKLIIDLKEIKLLKIGGYIAYKIT